MEPLSSSSDSGSSTLVDMPIEAATSPSNFVSLPTHQNIKLKSIKLSRVPSLEAKTRINNPTAGIISSPYTDSSQESTPSQLSDTPSSSTNVLQNPGAKLKSIKRLSSMRSRRPSIVRRSYVGIDQKNNINKSTLPTCSSALKDSKLNAKTEPKPGDNNEAEQISDIKKVCPYTYCSLHGHRHDNLPPLKRYVSIRRRLITPQKNNSTKSESHSNFKPKRLGNKKKRLADVPPSSVVEEVTDDVESKTSRKKKQQQHMGLWRLIHQHIASGIDEEIDNLPPLNGETSEKQAKVEEDDSVVNQRNELSKSHAIKMVQAAFDRILAEIPDQSSDDHQSTASDTTPDNDIHISAKDCIIEDAEEKKTNSDVQDRIEPKIPNSWNNLKKMILLKRFVKALEKVKKINSQKPRYLDIEADSEAEKVRLRHSAVDGRKNTEQWMLDYALRQVVSTLAPAQKRKVALLVQAFETIIPLPEVETHTRLNSTSSTPSRTTPFYDSILSSGKAKIKLKQNQEHETDITETERFTSIKAEGLLVSTPGGGNANDLVHSSTQEAERTKSNYELSEKSCQLPSENEESTSNIKVVLSDALSKIMEKAKKEHKSIPQPNFSKDKASETKLDKQNFSGFWYLIHKHMSASNDTVEHGQGEANKEDHQTNLNSHEYSNMEENQNSMSQETELHKNEVIKMVEEAIDEIPLPDSRDNSPDNQSVTSETTTEDDLPQNNRKEANEEEIKANTLEKKSSKPQMNKSWSNLKKMILLKKFVKAMEKVRKLNPKKPQFLPLQSGAEAEKVNLRHQNMEDRKNSEEWMLDHALQQVVAQLTPARKRKVQLLVEAFETVVPN